MAARNPFGVPVDGDVEAQLSAVLGSHAERVLAELDDRLGGAYDDVPWDELSEGYRTVKPFVRMPRSETRYTGLMGREHTQSLQKGYLDLGLVDPQFAKMLKAHNLGDWLLAAMKQEGVAYIRDPEGVLKKSGVSVNDIADGIKQDLESYYAERSEVADTPEERDALERIFKAIKGARITFSSVKGRQGDPGYKVVMTPSPGKIQAMGEDVAELANGEPLDEVRPGPHWNPWPQEKTKSNEFVKSLEDLARVNSSVGMWSKETADIVANVAWAMKKGDKAKVKKLRKLLTGQSDVSAGLVNEINHWLKGWMESTEPGEGLLDEAARTWSANGYLEIKTAEMLTSKKVKAIKRYVMRWADGGERAGPSMLPKGRRWKATDVLLTGGKLMVAFQTDAEPTRRTVTDIENEVIGPDGLGGMLWQFAVKDAGSPDKLQMSLYGGNYQADDPMNPLRVVGMDISSSVGLGEDMDEAMAVGVTSYDVPSPKGLEPRGSSTDAGAMLAFSNAFAKLLKKLKKDVPGVKRVYGGYKGTGRQKSRRQVWVDFKEGMTDRNLDLWVSGSMVTLGGVLGPMAKARISTVDRTPDEVYRDLVRELKVHAKGPVEHIQGSGTSLEEAKVRRRRKVKAKKARRRQRAVAAGVKPDKPDKVYKSSVSMSTPEGFFIRMVTYKLPMADSKAPPGAERALLILDDSEVPDGAFQEIVGYLGRPDSERQRRGGFEAGFTNAPEWTAYDTDGRVVASKMMFADAVSDLLLFYNDEIEAAALDYLKAPSRGEFASAFSR